MKNSEKFIKSFFWFGPSDLDKKKIKTFAKYKVPVNTDLDDDIDDNAVALLCLPDGILRLTDSSEKIDSFNSIGKNYSEFHSFLITKEDGLRIYGSTLIIYEKLFDDEIQEYNYFSKVLCLLTKYPFIVCTEKILNYIWQNNCSIEVIQLICNVRLPQFGKCVRLILPEVLAIENENENEKKSINFLNKCKLQCELEDNLKFVYQNEGIYIFPGTKDFPLYDYSSKYLFTEVLSIENFLVAFTATLLEYQILITSSSLYKLMLVAESLTSFLLPFKWQHVYVPILPSKLGLHYLDAPTPYIMGVINYEQTLKNLSSNSNQISLSNSIRCKIDCDLNMVEFYAENGSVGIVNKRNEFEENSNEQIDDLDEQNNNCAFTVPQFLSDLQKEIEEFINKDPLIANDFRNQSNAIKRITEIAIKHNVINKSSYLDDVNFNQAIRLIFYDYLKQHLLSNYERYIVLGKKDTVKFDSVSFLSDQPLNMQNFLTKFLKTQIFASYIDESARLLCKNRLIDKGDKLYITDSNEFIEEFVDEIDDSKYNIDCNRLDNLFKNAAIINLNLFLKNKKIINTDINSVTGHELTTSTTNIKKLHSPFKVYSPKKTNNFIQFKNKINNYQNLSFKTQKSSETDFNEDELVSRMNSAKENLWLLEDRGIINSTLNSPLRQTEVFAQQTNWRVVESLLKEVKNKTKRILIEKMGDEEVAPLGLGVGDDYEENSLIAALCDLIERIWTHAKSSEASHFRCAFWVHVSAFCQISNTTTNEKSTNLSNKNLNLSPAIQNSRTYENQKFLHSDTKNQKKNFSKKDNNLQDGTFSGHTNLNLVSPVPTSIFYDYNSVNKMSDIKTEIGKSRAFIRLALERKLLSKHLRTLLSNQQLTCAFYKRYAFLRCDDEKEQFLIHLLTLNAVDLMPFTNTFTTSTLKYTLVFYGSSAFNGHFSLSGSLFDLIDQPILHAVNVYTFECRNLGTINSLTLRINNNNKLYLEFCFLINEITGQTYRFQSNRWFGKNIDDGACEHVFNVQTIPNEQACEVLKKFLQSKNLSVGRHWSKAFDIDKKETICLEELKDLLGKSVNIINRLYHNNYNLNQNLLNNNMNTANKTSINANGKKFSNNRLIKKLNIKFIELNGQLNNSFGKENANNLQFDSTIQSPIKTLKIKHQKDLSKTNRINLIKLEQSLAKLLFGDRQLIWILQQVFYFAFKNKSKSSFKKQLFVWDYLLRVQCQFKLNFSDYGENSKENLNLSLNEFKKSFNNFNSEKDVQRFYVNLIDRITTRAMYCGKDGKLNLFLLIALREHMLTKFINLLSSSPVVSQFYETNSFLRDDNKILFLHEILKPLEIVNFNLDQSFTKGL